MNAETQTVNLSADGNCTGTIDVLHLGNNRYRIVDPLISLVSETVEYHDVVQAEMKSEDRLVVQRVVEKGDFRTFAFGMTGGWHERESVQAILERVTDLGGAWDGVFGGLLYICLPSGVDYDPTEDIAKA